MFPLNSLKNHFLSLARKGRADTLSIAPRPHRNLIFSLRGDCEGAGDMGGGGEGNRAERDGAFDEKTQVGAKIYKRRVQI